MIQYPAFKVAAAHVAPVFLDIDRSVQRACSVIEEAAAGGARLIAFPEAFLPGFPVWAALEAPIRTHELFKRLAARTDLSSSRLGKISRLSMRTKRLRLRCNSAAGSRPFRTALQINGCIAVSRRIHAHRLSK